MASIRKKGRSFEVRIKVSGVSKSKTFATLQECRTWARFAETELSDELKLTNHPGSLLTLPTLAQALTRYSIEVLPSLKGAAQERYRMNQLTQLPLADKCLDAITSSDVKIYRDKLLAMGNSGSTVRLKLSLLSRVFSVAAKEWGMALINPVFGVSKPAAGKARTRRLVNDEEQRLFAAASTCQNPNIYPLIIFALETGMRRSEMLNMTWSESNLDRGVVELVNTKSGHPRWVPLSKAAKCVLERQKLSGAPSPFPIPATTLENAWEHVLRRACISNLRFHDLRHEALSRWAHRLNGDVFKLSLVSGHRTLQMAQRYVHPVQSELLAQLAM